MLFNIFCCNTDFETYACSSETLQELAMNWFPVLSALAIVVLAFLGVDSPGRAIAAQVCIAFLTIVGLGLGWWKESRYGVQALR
jgi:hypothetical protein